MRGESNQGAHTCQLPTCAAKTSSSGKHGPFRPCSNSTSHISYKYCNHRSEKHGEQHRNKPKRNRAEETSPKILQLIEKPTQKQMPEVGVLVAVMGEMGTVTKIDVVEDENRGFVLEWVDEGPDSFIPLSRNWELDEGVAKVAEKVAAVPPAPVAPAAPPFKARVKAILAALGDEVTSTDSVDLLEKIEAKFGIEDTSGCFLARVERC